MTIETEQIVHIKNEHIARHYAYGKFFVVGLSLVKEINNKKYWAISLKTLVYVNGYRKLYMVSNGYNIEKAQNVIKNNLLSDEDIHYIYEY